MWRKVRSSGPRTSGNHPQTSGIQSISILTVNVRSLRKNINNLEALVFSLESPPSVICLTETWLNEDDDKFCYLLKGYNCLSSIVRDSRGGGVMIQIHETISLVKELSSCSPESAFVQLKAGNFCFQVLTCYNPPRTNKLEFLDISDSFLESCSDDLGIVICGDFNINTLDCNLISRNYLNAITANGYNFLIDEPTRVSNESATCIDHYITKNIVVFQSLVMEAENFTDHYPIYHQFFVTVSKILLKKFSGTRLF